MACSSLFFNLQPKLMSFTVVKFLIFWETLKLNKNHQLSITIDYTTQRLNTWEYIHTYLNRLSTPVSLLNSIFTKRPILQVKHLSSINNVTKTMQILLPNLKRVSFQC